MKCCTRMPIKLITEIERPPSLYAKLTGGTILEPWLWKAFEDSHYLHKPFHCWKREDGLFERIGRMGHIGFCVGLVNGVASGYLSNLSRGVHGSNHYVDRIAWNHASMGMVTGLLQSTVFTVTVSVMSILRKQDDDYFDWYMGGLTTGLVTLVMSQQKNVLSSKKWNSISIGAIPLLLCMCKYLRLTNEYDDPKGGRYPGRAGGPQFNSPAEQRALYGTNPNPCGYPLEMTLIKKENPEMLFLKPRQNPKWNDKWRTDREDAKAPIHKDDYRLDELVA